MLISQKYITSFLRTRLEYNPKTRKCLTITYTYDIVNEETKTVSEKTVEPKANGDERIFLRLFKKIKQEIINNPDMLYKNYWKGLNK